MGAQEYKFTPMDEGLVNHLAFGDPSHGYILGLGGTGGTRDVCTGTTNIALITNTIAVL